jgi:hypothetical protein
MTMLYKYDNVEFTLECCKNKKMLHKYDNVI